MPWTANLHLDYAAQGGRTVAHHRHDGPLRILQSLYPEGDAICHNVLVHPPGGLVGGDTLNVHVSVAPGAHGLISTPGATRFYRTAAEPATQNVTLTVRAGGRLEWLPLETIAYDSCLAFNHTRLHVEPTAELIAWDVCAFGLPAADAPFLRGRYTQHLHWPGVWLERARFDAADTRLMNSPVGMAGHRCLALLVWACGEPVARERRERVLDALRQASAPPEVHWGVTSPNPNMIVARALAPVVEPAMALMRALWATLRSSAWSLPDRPPRIWNV